MDSIARLMSVGRITYDKDLNSSHSGNISFRASDGSIHITRRGSMLGFLTEGDVIRVEAGGEHPQASRELPVHRAIYDANPSVGAVVHVHALHATVLSTFHDEILPADAEGRYYLPRIPVLECANPIGSDELAAGVSSILQQQHAVIVRSHGVFAAGRDLDEALLYASCTESICHILYMTAHYQQRSQPCE